MSFKKTTSRFKIKTPVVTIRQKKKIKLDNKKLQHEKQWNSTYVYSTLMKRIYHGVDNLLNSAIM